MKKNVKTTIVILAISLFFPARVAHAYIDPGTGSYFLQIVIASFFGGIFVFKNYLKILKEKIFSKNAQQKSKDETTKNI